MKNNKKLYEQLIKTLNLLPYAVKVIEQVDELIECILEKEN